MKLHRLEANIQPGNGASIALVRSCGFSKEGIAALPEIGGRWRDHERWRSRLVEYAMPARFCSAGDG
jgi:ribosomal-protein-alanine N-acetyltransferase